MPPQSRSGRGSAQYGLEHADGFWFLRTEGHSVTDHRPPTVHERVDALVDVANAVLRGATFVRTGRRVTYESEECDVAWCLKSSTPAVGSFPGRHAEDGRTPFTDTAIRLLADAGLHPAVFGGSVGDGGFMVEQEGFQVNSAPQARHGSSHVWVFRCGRGTEARRSPQASRPAEQVSSAPAVPRS
ncbi:hypothetical protein PV343_11285 [Streptomyces sp. WI03-4A]|uniref:hypothetical protein n=1 Tax=Streptomyces sp. WI03-4A TaxID=3028706 RepID=UPI0029BD3DFA|nr:hypothetical protein [Streptomyces sp. WI03-4A]MDX2592836.1 hypothetical protein [Streptomyces sp. WI03-4A]